MYDSTQPADGDDAEVVVRHSVRQNLAHMMTSQLITWIVAMVSALIVPRYLGPATAGDLRLAGSLWLIASTITALGTSRFLQLEIARNQREGLGLVGPVLVLRTIAFAACSISLATYIALTAETAEFVVIAAMIGLATLVGVWSDVFSASFVGLERMSITAFAAAAGKFIASVLVILFLVAGGGVVAVVTVGVVVGVAGLAYLTWQFRQFSRVTVASWRPQARGILRGSTTFMAAGVALVLYQQIDVVVISWVAESEALGWYGAADLFFGSLLFPAMVVTGAVFPTLGRLHTSDRAALEELVARTFSTLSVLAVPIGLGTALVAPDLAPLLLGEDFRETGPVLAVLGPVIILTFGTILFGGTALATERGRVWVVVIFGAALLTVPLDIVLVPWADHRFDNGAIGGALAYIVTEAVQFAIGIWLIVPFLATFDVAWRTLRILAAGGLMVAVGWPLRHSAIPVTIVTCGVTYSCAVLAFRVLGEEERRMVGSLLARVGIRNRWAR